MRKLPINPGGTIFNRTTQNLAFADDIAMIGRSRKYLSECLKELQKEAIKYGLSINQEKTKYMINTRNKTRWRGVQDFEGYERVKQFKYLGGVVSEDNEVSLEIKARLAAGNRCYFSFQRLLKSSLITRKLKLLVYKTIIKPVVLYGSETWTMTSRDGNRLNVWERKILRKIYGAVCEDGVWRIRTNNELEALYGNPNIVTDIKMRRLRWLGHVQRMGEERVPKKVLYSTPEGSRSVGHPRLRWMEDVEADLRKMGIRNWRSLAVSRENWRTLVIDKAQALQGL